MDSLLYIYKTTIKLNKICFHRIFNVAIHAKFLDHLLCFCKTTTKLNKISSLYSFL